MQLGGLPPVAMQVPVFRSIRSRLPRSAVRFNGFQKYRQVRPDGFYGLSVRRGIFRRFQPFEVPPLLAMSYLHSRRSQRQVTNLLLLVANRLQWNFGKQSVTAGNVEL